MAIEPWCHSLEAEMGRLHCDGSWHAKALAQSCDVPTALRPWSTIPWDKGD
ncbi:hypothetical protein IG631_01909 [Alternaria alternata]|nr:hypothetical protein IG631_01909 [Alternaria alternata]